MISLGGSVSNALCCSFAGITCLFLASKMEEIYPPKIQQFAEVTDGACTEAEIFAMEVAILKVRKK